MPPLDESWVAFHVLPEFEMSTAEPLVIFHDLLDHQITVLDIVKLHTRLGGDMTMYLELMSALRVERV